MSGSLPGSMRGSPGMAMMPHDMGSGPVPTHLRSRVYVGNIPWQMSDDDVALCFSQIGTVREAKVVLDRDTGRSKGFAFVTFETEECARMAIDRWNGSQLGGRTIKIGQAQPPSSAAVAMSMGPGSMHAGMPMTLMPPGSTRGPAPGPAYPPPTHPAYAYGGYGESAGGYGGGPGMYAPPPQHEQYHPASSMPRRAPPPGAGGSMRASPMPYPEPSYAPSGPHGLAGGHHAMHSQAQPPRYHPDRAYAPSSPSRMGTAGVVHTLPDGRAALAFASGTPVPPADLASDTPYSMHTSHSSASSMARAAHDAYMSGESAWYSGKEPGANVGVEAPSHTTIFGDGWRTDAAAPDSIDSIAASVAQLALDHRTTTADTPATWAGPRDVTASYPAMGSSGSGEYGSTHSVSSRGVRTAGSGYPPGLASMSTLPPDTTRYVPAGAAAQLQGGMLYGAAPSAYPRE